MLNNFFNGSFFDSEGECEDEHNNGYFLYNDNSINNTIANNPLLQQQDNINILPKSVTWKDSIDSIDSIDSNNTVIHKQTIFCSSKYKYYFFTTFFIILIVFFYFLFFYK